jgi:ribosome-binding protein aMBF1 (putative translation factor)
MGVASVIELPRRPLSDAERCAAVAAALRDGTVSRVRAVLGWSAADLAERLNVLPSLVDSWESGEVPPTRYSALKLWTLLVCALRYEGAAHAS